MSAPHSLDSATDPALFDEIERLADAATSSWRSIAEAASRSERMTVEVHFRQVRLVTFHVFRNIKELSIQKAGMT